ncbi:MAG: EFR1 family ferrodoxin, partial [Coriobacteriia bacterium]|nr:EFR1 family ferrodoxin [Coriobacteriia bacterium]
MKTFYFTGTGNSLQVARGVSSGGELISIPRFLREQQNSKEQIIVSDSVIGLVFPTYWLAIPPLVVRFLEQVKFETEYLFAITTRGYMSLTLKAQLLHIAKTKGYRFSYYNQLTMPDNWLPMYSMD